MQSHGLQPARFLCPWDSPGKNIEVGCHFLLQRIFPTQESNPGLLHCRQILYQLNYEESPKEGVCHLIMPPQAYALCNPLVYRQAWSLPAQTPEWPSLISEPNFSSSQQSNSFHHISSSMTFNLLGFQQSLTERNHRNLSIIEVKIYSTQFWKDVKKQIIWHIIVKDFHWYHSFGEYLNHSYEKFECIAFNPEFIFFRKVYLQAYENILRIKKKSKNNTNIWQWLHKWCSLIYKKNSHLKKNLITPYVPA